jgi:hypothetical protein
MSETIRCASKLARQLEEFRRHPAGQSPRDRAELRNLARRLVDALDDEDAQARQGRMLGTAVAR